METTETKISAKPVRLQRKRVKGFNLQATSRAANGLPGKSVCRPGKWGNPFVVTGGPPEKKDEITRMAIKAFEDNLDPATMTAAKKELRGFNLFCFCAENAPCHADVLLRIANED